MTDIDEAVAAYVARLPWPSRRRDAVALVDLMRRATGQEPRVYDRTIGYGMYHYRYPRARGDYAGVYTKRAREGGSGS